jgi:hypothetical protein
MAINYTKSQALAQKLIEANGREVVFNQLGGAPADPLKPWAGAGPASVVNTVTAKGLFASTSISGKDLGIDVKVLDLLPRVSEVVLVAGSAGIDDFNFIIDGSVRWRIEWIQTLKPGPTTILYYVGVNR